MFVASVEATSVFSVEAFVRSSDAVASDGFFFFAKFKWKQYAQRKLMYSNSSRKAMPL